MSVTKSLPRARICVLINSYRNDLVRFSARTCQRHRKVLQIVSEGVWTFVFGSLFHGSLGPHRCKRFPTLDLGLRNSQEPGARRARGRTTRPRLLENDAGQGAGDCTHCCREAGPPLEADCRTKSNRTIGRKICDV